MDYRILFDDPNVKKNIFLNEFGTVVYRFEHPEFVFEVTTEA